VVRGASREIVKILDRGCADQGSRTSDPGRGAIALRISIRADDGEEPQSPHKVSREREEGEEYYVPRACTCNHEHAGKQARMHACTHAGELIIPQRVSPRAGSDHYSASTPEPVAKAWRREGRCGSHGGYKLARIALAIEHPAGITKPIQTKRKRTRAKSLGRQTRPRRCHAEVVHKLNGVNDRRNKRVFPDNNK